MGKKIFLSSVGFVSAWMVYVINTLIFSFLFGLLLKIPFLVRVLSWPVPAEYYVSVSVNIIPVGIAVAVCNMVCRHVSAKRYIGTIIFCISIILTSAIAIVFRLASYGFSYHIIGYGVAGLTSLFALFEGTHAERA